MESTTVKTASGISIIAGIWLIIAPFVLGNSGIATILWNEIIFGILAIIFAGIQYATPEQRWPSWVNFVIGVWLLISPFALSAYSTSASGQTNELVLGVIVGLASLWAALTVPRQAHP